MVGVREAHPGKAVPQPKTIDEKMAHALMLRDIHGSPFVEVTTYGYDKKPGTSDDRRKLILEEDARRWEDRKSYR